MNMHYNKFISVCIQRNQNCSCQLECRTRRKPSRSTGVWLLVDPTHSPITSHRTLSLTYNNTQSHIHTHRESLYPFLNEHNLDEIVEDNASPHNNDSIRLEHQRNNVRLVGYTATEEEKDHIRQLIRDQVSHTFIVILNPMHLNRVVFFVTRHFNCACRCNIIDENKIRKHR